MVSTDRLEPCGCTTCAPRDLKQVARMHVDAIGTAVDLRDAQLDPIDALSGQIRLRDIGVNAAKGLYADRSNCGGVQTLRHGTFLKGGVDNASVEPAPTGGAERPGRH